VTGDRSLAAVDPWLAAQWHPIRNGGLSPHRTLPASSRVWWRCPHGHEWEARIARRLGGNGCPFCTGSRAAPDTCLAARRPALAAEWHPSRNGALTPAQVTPGSALRVWWRCGEGHEWEAVISSRARSGCPYCSGRRPTPERTLAARAPALAAEWHPTRNGDLGPEQVAAASGRRVWWRCGAGHEWEAQVGRRARGSGCPYCAGRRASAERSLAAIAPALAAEWHPVRNAGLGPEEVTPAASRMVWWRCAEGHEWAARPAARIRGSGCPFCSGRRLSPERSLATLAPRLAAEWHPTRNGDLSPTDVFAAGGRRVWWRCAVDPGHAWQARLISRYRAGTGCPYCAGKRITPERSLAALAPEIAREWHPSRNGDLTPADVFGRSGLRVWWRCARGHEWATGVSTRVRSGAGCPACAVLGPRRIPLAQARPDLLREWDRALNVAVPEEVPAGSKLRAWWRCAADPAHIWGAQVRNRVRGGTGCPYCAHRLPSVDTCLAAVAPALAAQWHPERNGALSPSDLLPASFQPVWWRCERGHEWRAAPALRRVSGCPYCARVRALPETSLAATHPHLAREWDLARNQGFTAAEVLAGSDRKVWWRCGAGHEWVAPPSQRTLMGTGCPYCAGRRPRPSAAERSSIPAPPPPGAASANGAGPSVLASQYPDNSR
jgi:putative zinc ribbon protein